MIRGTVAGDPSESIGLRRNWKQRGGMRVADQLASNDTLLGYTMTAPVPNHVHYGIVSRWIDGDSLYIMGDLDFRHYGALECRLIGVNTPERGKLNYKEATLEANNLAPVGSKVVFRSEPDPEKWGRWLVELWANDVDVDEALIASGLGVAYFGGKR